MLGANGDTQWKEVSMVGACLVGMYAGADLAGTSFTFFSLVKSDEPCGFTVGVNE